MYFIIIHYFILFNFIVPRAQCVEISKTIINYFNSDNVRLFSELWKKYEISYESAFLTMLRENYGHPAMNVYVRKMFDMLVIAQAFYVSDNVLDVLMKDLRVVHLPVLTTSEVDIDLDTNLARFKGVLSKIIIQGQYRLLRNHTAVVFSGSDQNLQKTSPFSLQQVQNTGQLSIIADGCRLNGLAIAKLSGMSVDLGHNTFVLDNCDLYVEIWTPGLGSPPIIAPYFSKKQGTQLEQLLSKPMREELMPKLQAAMYSYINTSAIFGKDLPKFRVHQSKLFQETSTYLRNVVVAYNNLAVAKGKDTFTLANKRIAWTEKIKRRSQSFDVTISGVTVYGLDTAYLSHNGGPYQYKTIKIEDEIRFNKLQVRGQITVKSNTKEQRIFGAELHDVVVNLVIGVDAKQLTLQRLEVVGWRTMELNHFEIDSISSRSFLTGYLNNEIPAAVSKQMKDMFVEALKQSDKNLQISNHGDFNDNDNSDENKDQNDEENITDYNMQNNTDENIDLPKDENNSENNNDFTKQNTVLKLKVSINKYNTDDTAETPADEKYYESGEAFHQNTDDNVLGESPEENGSENKNNASHKTANEGILKVKVNLNKYNTDDTADTPADEKYNEEKTAEDESNDKNRSDTFHNNDDKNVNDKTIDTVEYEKNDKNIDNVQNSDQDLIKMKIKINKYDNEKSMETAEDENNSKNIDDVPLQNADENVVKMKVNVNKDNNAKSLETADDEKSSQNMSDDSLQNADENVIKMKVNINKDNNDKSAEMAEDENDSKNIGDASPQNTGEGIIKMKININKNKNNNDKSQENREHENYYGSKGEAFHQINLQNDNFENEANSADKRKYIKNSSLRNFNSASEDTRNKFIKRKSMYTFRGIPMSDNEIHTE